MDFVLYDPTHGYYARAAQRSGRAGDFFTSVDVGPLFGELLAIQIAEMFALLERPDGLTGFDLIEAGAGNGRLSADILRALGRIDPDRFSRTALHLVEASPAARAAQHSTLGPLASHLRTASSTLPESFEGVLVANELIDAMPVHQVVMRRHGLQEVYVAVDGDALTLVEAEPSTPKLAEYLEHARARLEPGWRAEVSLAAVNWMRDAARRLRRGFMILIDYGHPARELYSVTHSTGTLTTFNGHRSGGPESAAPAWLADPGDQDITAHVDFTSVRAAAEGEGLTTVALLDQTYFLLGLISTADNPERFAHRSLKTLMMPGGLGSTMKVLMLGKGIGAPKLRGCAFATRLT